MGIRSTVADAVRNVAGDETLAKLKRADAVVRHAAISALDVEGRNDRPAAPAPAAPAYPPLSPEERRLAAEAKSVQRPRAPLSRHALLGGLHAALAPRTYFEIGMRNGESLTLSRARTIAVDPDYHLTSEIACDLRSFRTTSDEFFQRPDAFDHFDGVGIDLAFIDGMHLSEFVVRDFMNAEKHAAPGAVVVLDDMLPRNHVEAYRDRRSRKWTGDVYKAIEVLRDYRPDLTIVDVNTGPTGTTVIAGLDPTNTVLNESYDQFEARLLAADPQVVPQARLDRSESVDPQTLLASDVWAEAVSLRAAGGDHPAFAELYRRLAEIPRYGPTTDGSISA